MGSRQKKARHAATLLLKDLDLRAFPVKCAACGYDLRAATGRRCPECGVRFSKVARLRETYGPDLVEIAAGPRDGDPWADVDWHTASLGHISPQMFPVRCPACRQPVFDRADTVTCPGCGETGDRRWLLWQQYGPEAFGFYPTATSETMPPARQANWPAAWVRMAVLSVVGWFGLVIALAVRPAPWFVARCGAAALAFSLLAYMLRRGGRRWLWAAALMVSAGLSFDLVVFAGRILGGKLGCLPVDPFFVWALLGIVRELRIRTPVSGTLTW